MGSPLTVDDDEIVHDVVVIFGDLDVEGEVKGEVVVIGSVEIDGIVDGDVTVVGGSVSVGDDADVYGDVHAVGGRVHDPEERIRGHVTQEALAPLGNVFKDWDDGWDWGWWDPPWLDLVNLVMNSVLLAIVVLLFVAAARRKAGLELRALQRGEAPADFRPMPSVGANVMEIRIQVGAVGTNL